MTSTDPLLECPSSLPFSVHELCLKPNLISHSTLCHFVPVVDCLVQYVLRRPVTVLKWKRVLLYPSVPSQTSCPRRIKLTTKFTNEIDDTPFVLPIIKPQVDNPGPISICKPQDTHIYYKLRYSFLSLLFSHLLTRDSVRLQISSPSISPWSFPKSFPCWSLDTSLISRHRVFGSLCIKFFLLS